VTGEFVVAGNNQNLLAFVERCQTDKELLFFDILGEKTLTMNFLINSRMKMNKDLHPCLLKTLVVVVLDPRYTKS
jgi:hypothetical protein